MSRTDKDALEWLYQRMVGLHGENPSIDYMLRFRKIINEFEGKRLNGHRMDYSKVKLLSKIGRINKDHRWVKIQQDEALIKKDEIEFTIQTDAVHASRLKWFGLVELKERRSGLYRITREGVDFLKGSLAVPTIIYCRSGEVIKTEEEEVYVNDVRKVVMDKAYWDDYALGLAI